VVFNDPSGLVGTAGPAAAPNRTISGAERFQNRTAAAQAKGKEVNSIARTAGISGNAPKTQIKAVATGGATASSDSDGGSTGSGSGGGGSGGGGSGGGGGGDQITYQPLTRDRLEELGVNAGIGGQRSSGEFTSNLGNQFEKLAAEAWGFAGKAKVPFKSAERSFRTNGEKQYVEPDNAGYVFINDGSMLAHINPANRKFGSFVEVVSGYEMLDVKSTGGPSIALSYDKYQLLGMIDVVSNTQAGMMNRGVLTLITLGGVSIGDGLISEAMKRKVTIYQIVALEKYVNGKPTGLIGFSIPYPIAPGSNKRLILPGFQYTVQNKIYFRALRPR
jgi:hypothetical protein